MKYQLKNGLLYVLFIILLTLLLVDHEAKLC